MHTWADNRPRTREPSRVRMALLESSYARYLEEHCPCRWSPEPMSFGEFVASVEARERPVVVYN